MKQIYIDTAQLYAAGDSIVGRVRQANEDNCGYASTPNGQLFVLCDGMGGHLGGATASKLAVESIIGFLNEHTYTNKPKALFEALAFANIQVLATAEQDPNLKGMGTTACVVLVDDDDIWLAHVGDSRIYLFTENDKHLYRITRDHSLVQALVEMGQIDDREAESHPKKNVILKALGTNEELEPDVLADPIHVAPNDVIMLCSDGLSGMVNDDELELILRKDMPLDNKVDVLISTANAEDKGVDNITVQLIEVRESKFAHAEFTDLNPAWRNPTSVSEHTSVTNSISNFTPIPTSTPTPNAASQSTNQPFADAMQKSTRKKLNLVMWLCIGIGGLIITACTVLGIVYKDQIKAWWMGSELREHIPDGLKDLKKNSDVYDIYLNEEWNYELI